MFMGNPFECIIIKGHSKSAATSTDESSKVKPETSFHMSAPAFIAAFATKDFLVSIEIEASS